MTLDRTGTRDLKIRQVHLELCQMLRRKVQGNYPARGNPQRRRYGWFGACLLQCRPDPAFDKTNQVRCNQVWESSWILKVIEWKVSV